MRAQISFACLCLILASVSIADDTADVTDSRHMLFVGHSFFHPVASKLEHAVQVLGIEGHSQQVIAASGKTGSPEALWFGDKADRVKQALDSGEVDLFGLTFYDEKSGEYEDYQRWIDYALAQNPDTNFFIGEPWGSYPETKTLVEYESENQYVENLLSGIINQLERAYPDTEFLFLNYGRGAVELRRMLEADALLDTTLLGDRKSAIYTDDIGHAGNVLAELVVWLWVTELFENVDLSKREVSASPMATLAARLSVQ